MPRFHHANLGVPPDLMEPESAFLVDVLGYQKVTPPADLVGRVHWYQDDDGGEIHLSVDPDHRPAARAHTAIEIDEGVEARLDAAGVAYRSGSFGNLVLTFCADPAGNQWELRRPLTT